MKPDPVEKSLWVPLKPAPAFDLFTRDLARWWPLDTHSLSAGAQAIPQRLDVDAREGGAIVETLPDGSTGIWGSFTRFDPPGSLEIAWHVGRSPAEATRIRVGFAPERDGTRLTLVHDGFEVLAEAAVNVRDSYQGGWDGVLARFGDAAAQPA